MIRRHLIIFIGLIACAIGYAAVYVASTSPARTLQEGSAPELAWLKVEFNLGDAEFKRISDLHAAYLPHCREMCAKIDTHNTQLKALLNSSKNLSPEIERSLVESGRLKAECQAMMLKHFFDVSRTMPPEEGRRYLAFVQEKAFDAGYGMPPTNSALLK